jgi:hypothetical protein
LKNAFVIAGEDMLGSGFLKNAKYHQFTLAGAAPFILKTVGVAGAVLKKGIVTLNGNINSKNAAALAKIGLLLSEKQAKHFTGKVLVELNVSHGTVGKIFKEEREDITKTGEDK